MAAPKLRIRFPLMAGTTDTYVVEEHYGSRVTALGRIAKFGPRWAALPAVAPDGWTPFRTTRREALEDLRRTTNA